MFILMKFAVANITEPCNRLRCFGI